METEKKVKEILVDILGVEEEEVKLESNLVDDLAAESIDFVDIAYALEKEFDVGKINPGDIFPTFMLEPNVIDENGKITADATKRLTEEYPHIGQELIDDLEENGNENAFLTVSTLVNFVKARLTLSVAK